MDRAEVLHHRLKQRVLGSRSERRQDRMELRLLAKLLPELQRSGSLRLSQFDEWQVWRFPELTLRQKQGKDWRLHKGRGARAGRTCSQRVRDGVLDAPLPRLDGH
ncbi:hypothetical protein [Mumia zhuanghuii]|uniref:hypothetical protein n=1 Tax=Mumia zhuanghuii TaxID=2585211 RepID=UPI0011119EE9|nr:hypothetical protein [Mumia zhuanghuii]